MIIGKKTRTLGALGLLGLAGTAGGYWLLNSGPDLGKSVSFDKYEKRNPTELVRFTSNRRTRRIGGTEVALGCHESIFEGINYLELEPTKSSKPNQAVEDTSNKRQYHNPSKLTFPETKQDYPLVGCSTAYVRKVAENKKVYEWEMAIRKGDYGFIERVSVSDESITSQIVLYTKNYGGSAFGNFYQYPFNTIEAFQRQLKPEAGQKFTYTIPNLDSQNKRDWKTLDIGNAKTPAPHHYVVWVEGDGQSSILDNLGIKVDNKLFSSVARPDDTPAKDRFFRRSGGSGSTAGYLIHSQPFYDLSVLDNITKVVLASQGSWQKIEDFCGKYERNGKRLYKKDSIQVRQYCYSKKKVNYDPKIHTEAYLDPNEED